ncbi:MAG: xylulokinase [Actinomycetota bacterium]
MTDTGDKYMLGLDLGTTGAKAGVMDVEGKVLGTSSAGYPTETPRPGWAEQDPALWWEASCRAIRGALSASGVAADDVAGVGVSGQMHGSVFLDGSGGVVRPCILWCDQRTGPECALIEEKVGRESLAGLVGNPALPGFTAPKVLWLARNEPDSFERVRWLLLPKDYINLMLTGETVTEVSDASGTLLFDVAGRRWSEPMLQALEIPAEWLPPVIESAQPAGRVTAEAARATWLVEGTVVAGGGADNACGALGMGVLEPGQVAVSIGSSGTVLAPTATPIVDERMRLHSFCHARPDTWYLMGVMLSAGLSLRWFRDALGEPERSEAEALGRDPYELLDKTASRAPAGCEGLVFLPYLTGERTPHADPDARGVLFGLDLTKGRSHVVRSVLEGVVYGLRDSLSLMREMGVPVTTVLSGGGGARSSLWRRIQADAFGMPVTVAGNPDAAMLGAGLLGGVAAGLFDSVDEACDRAVRYGETIEPDPAAGPAYDRAYEVYRALYPALREIYWL